MSKLQKNTNKKKTANLANKNGGKIKVDDLSISKLQAINKSIEFDNFHKMK